MNKHMHSSDGRQKAWCLPSPANTGFSFVSHLLSLKPLTIRWKLLLLVLCGASLILSVVIGYTYHAARTMLEEELEAKAWILARYTAARIEAVTSTVEQNVSALTDALELHPTTDTDDVRNLLQRAVANNQYVYGAAIGFDEAQCDPEFPSRAPYACKEAGKITFSELTDSGYNYEIYDWYMLPKELGKPVWSEPYYDKGGADIIMVTYSAPFHSDSGKGPFAGVVTSDISLEWLSDLLGSLPLGKSGYAFLLSRNGAFIAHPDKNLILSENMFSLAESHDDPEFRNLARKITHGGSGFFSYQSPETGLDCWMVYVPVASTQWTLAALFPKKELMSQVHELNRVEIQIGIAGFLLLLLVVLLIANSIARPIQALDKAAMTLAKGDLEASLPIRKGNDEIAHLTNSFATMRDELKQYMEELKNTIAAKERIESELRIAHDIQMGLVPRTFPPFPNRTGLELHALIDPAREVGGDFYDFFMTREDEICVAIGDVSGKGVPAALFMAVTRSFLRSFAREETDPSQVLFRLNNELSKDNDACMFVTLFCAFIDLRTGECRFANGGHNLPMIVHKNGFVETIPQIPGAALGAFEEAEFSQGLVALQPDDTLFLYTDGVTEAQNPKDELYGEERTEQRLAELCDVSCEDLLQSLREALALFAEEAEQFDDITMLALRATGFEPPQNH